MRGAGRKREISGVVMPAMMLNRKMAAKISFPLAIIRSTLLAPHFLGARRNRFPILFVGGWSHLSDLIGSILSLTLQTSLSFAHQRILLPNMWILPFLGYVGVILGFAFLTLAIGMLLS